MNYFDEAERLLAEVPKKERAISALIARRDRLLRKSAPSGGGSGTDYSKPYIKATYAADTLKELCELGDVCRALDMTIQEVAEIKNCVDAMLDETQKTCLKLWYFERMPKERIAERLERWSVTTIYNLRNKAIYEFALIYWGSTATKNLKKS